MSEQEKIQLFEDQKIRTAWDEDKEEWERHLPDFPKEWINGYDKKLVIKEKNLYDLKAIPTLYLLDKDKKVLLKDATVAQIDQYLQ